MHNTRAHVITNHLQISFGNYFKESKQIDKDNPLDLCGLCLFTEYIFRKLSTYELEEYIIKTVGWDILIHAFNEIKSNSHISLLTSLKKEFKYRHDDSDESEILSYWVIDHSKNDIYDKCITYLSHNLDNPKIEETLALLPPLPEANEELLDAGAMLDYKWIKKLLDAGADPNILDENNYSPLALAWLQYQRDPFPPTKAKKAVLLLIKSGSNPLLEKNRRILEHSAFLPETEIFEALLDNGWNVNNTKNPLCFELVDGIRQANNEPPVWKKAFKKSLDIAIKHKINLNRPGTHQGILPITFAVDDSVIDTLLKNGAKIEVEAKNNLYYLTPLMKAVHDNNIDRVKFWITKGCDVNKRLAIRFTQNTVTFPPGITALDFARIMEFQEIENYLISQEAIKGEPVSWLISITTYEGVEIDKDEIIKILTGLIQNEEYKSSYEETLKHLRFFVKSFIESNSPIDYIELSDFELVQETQRKLFELGFKNELI